MSNVDSVVMYLEKGDPTERFTQPMTHDGAKWAAKKLSSDGYEVIAIVTAEHAAERQSAGATGQPIEGAHLVVLLDDIVERFTRDYPGVPRESALEVVRLLCTLSLEGDGDENLQAALMDEIHMQPLIRSGGWRQDVRIAIANRRPQGE